MGKHMAWMMNPNLSGDAVIRLVEADAEREIALLRQASDAACNMAREHGEFLRGLGDPHWQRKGKQVALDYLSQALPLILTM